MAVESTSRRTAVSSWAISPRAHERAWAARSMPTAMCTKDSGRAIACMARVATRVKRASSTRVSGRTTALRASANSSCHQGSFTTAISGTAYRPGVARLCTRAACAMWVTSRTTWYVLVPLAAHAHSPASRSRCLIIGEGHRLRGRLGDGRLPRARQQDLRLGRRLHGSVVTSSLPPLSFAGSFVNGDRVGRGTCAYPSGAIYVGAWEYDRPHGEGMLPSCVLHVSRVQGCTVSQAASCTRGSGREASARARARCGCQTVPPSLAIS